MMHYITGRQLWRMYSHWRFFIRPSQDNLLFFGERKHPLSWIWRERIWTCNHCDHIWVFYLEGKDLHINKVVFLSRYVPLNCTDRAVLTSFFSSTLPKRTGAMKAHVLEFHAGQSEITTTIPPLTCGSIVHTVATCTMEGNLSAHFLPLPRVTPSPASWTWKLTPYHLLKMTRFGQISTVNIQGFLLLMTCFFL